MKKFTNVVMYFSAREAGVSGLEVITGDDQAKVEEHTRRTLVRWGEDDFKEEISEKPELLKELNEDPEQFYTEHSEGLGFDVAVEREVEITDADTEEDNDT